MSLPLMRKKFWQKQVYSVDDVELMQNKNVTTDFESIVSKLKENYGTDQNNNECGKSSEDIIINADNAILSRKRKSFANTVQHRIDESPSQRRVSFVRSVDFVENTSFYLSSSSSSSSSSSEDEQELERIDEECMVASSLPKWMREAKVLSLG